MGDLGPLRRPPKGWLPARAMPLGHRVTEQQSSDGSSGADALAMHTRLEVQWEIHIDGRAPYRFDEYAQGADVGAARRSCSGRATAGTSSAHVAPTG